MDDQEFQTHSGEALDDLYKRLNAASDGGEFEADFNAGALAIEFEEPPAKFVVSPNSPVRQIWVSAHSKSFKLDWDPARQEFVLAATGESLAQMVGGAISQQLGEEVKL
jgi:CyaY protein